METTVTVYWNYSFCGGRFLGAKIITGRSFPEFRDKLIQFCEQNYIKYLTASTPCDIKKVNIAFANMTRVDALNECGFEEYGDPVSILEINETGMAKNYMGR